MITLIVLFIVFLFAGVVLMLVAVKRKQMAWLYASLLSFLLMAACGGFAVYKLVTGSVGGLLRSRTGEQVYEAMFGKPAYDCVKVTQVQDQVIPVMDDAIFLSWETCPQEMRRILTRQAYSAMKVDTSSMEGSLPFGREDWFEKKGDSIWVYEAGQQKIWANVDSTRAFCRYLNK